MSFKVALIQNTADSLLEKTIDLVKEAAKNKAQIVSLQEIFAGPYFCTTQEQQKFDLAQTIDGELIGKFSKLAKELSIVLIAPFFEKRAKGLYANSAAVIDKDGSLAGVYRKMPIPDDPLYFEKYYFSPGEEGYKVFKTSVANLGVLICWDQWYPEAARITALKGAEIIFYPTAIGWHPSEKKEFGKAQLEAWRTIQRSHAIANGVFVASVNRVGHEETEGTDGIEFFGNSVIYGPFGEILSEAKTQNPEIIYADCDPKAIEETRRNWPFLRDRRIDSYKPILERVIDEK